MLSVFSSEAVQEISLEYGPDDLWKERGKLEGMAFLLSLVFGLGMARRSWWRKALQEPP